MFYINSEALQEIIGSDSGKLNELSTVIGFYKYEEYFVAGDSSAMNGIEFNWDKTTKVLTMRFIYMDSAYRMNGDELIKNNN